MVDEQVELRRAADRNELMPTGSIGIWRNVPERRRKRQRPGH
jgi:hypothetical protein